MTSSSTINFVVAINIQVLKRKKGFLVFVKVHNNCHGCSWTNISREGLLNLHSCRPTVFSRSKRRHGSRFPRQP